MASEAGAGAERDERTALVVLSRDECLTLLSSQAVGRLAVGGPGQAPLVVPVNYLVSGEAVVFRSDEGEKLRALSQWPASFQADAFDHYRHTGWSVLVSGMAVILTAREIAGMALEPWAPGGKGVWVRIEATVISGRRLKLLDVGGDRLGYL